MKSKFFKPRRQLHLALGGGGARALAHIGVLKVIEEHNFPIMRLSGTSGGAVIAALYAQFGDIQTVEHRARNFLLSEAFKKIGLEFFAEGQANKHNYFDSVGNFFHYLKSRLIYSRALIAESLFPAERLIELLSELFDEGCIEHTRIPLQIAAVNVDTGQDVVLDHGDLIKAVAASSAIPGIFSPVEFAGMRLIDGAVINPVPLVRADRQKEVVVGVDVSRCIRAAYPRRLALDYIFRADEITLYKLNELHLQKAEIVIRPEEVRHGHWADFRHIDAYIHSGEKAGIAKISELQDAMYRQDSWFKPWLRRKFCE